jgi:hypothetical protein
MIFLKELLEPRVFYRGETGGPERIQNDPFQHAKDVGGIFVSVSEKHAKNYGYNITTFTAKPSAKILRYDQQLFWRLIGKRMPPNKWLGSVINQKENLVVLFNKLVDLAKKNGYDAISFSDTDDIGTVILNKNEFVVS